MSGVSKGSTERRCRRAVSTSPSQERERASILGTERARVLFPTVRLFGALEATAGLEFSAGKGLWSGEIFRIFRGRRGIFAAGADVVEGSSGGPFSTSGVATSRVVDSCWGVIWGRGCDWFSSLICSRPIREDCKSNASAPMAPPAGMMAAAVSAQWRIAVGCGVQWSGRGDRLRLSALSLSVSP